MKERYTAPESNVHIFDVADILTTSTGGGSQTGGSGPIELPDIEL